MLNLKVVEQKIKILKLLITKIPKCFYKEYIEKKFNDAKIK